MELNIEGSKSNPKILFNSAENKLTIHGRSVLRNMDDNFYYPVYEFIDNFSASLKGLIVEIYLDYFNTSSHPSLIKIFQSLDKIEEVEIIWLYDQNDIEMMEIGQELQIYSPIKFVLKVVEIS